MLRAWADGGGGPTESRGLRLFLRLAHACQREPQTLSRLQQLQAGAAEVSQAEAQRLQQVGPRRPRVREARQAARANTCGGEKSNPTGASTRTCIGASAPTPRRTWAAPTLIPALCLRQRRQAAVGGRVWLKRTRLGLRLHLVRK